MKQFLVCWDISTNNLWVRSPRGEWRFRGTKGMWINSTSQDWNPKEFIHQLKVNNFKEN